MIKLHRSECSILPLVLERRWFDMIKDGIKHEEYRDSSDYWAPRFFNWDRKKLTPVVEFRLGYSPNAPRMAFWCYGINTTGGIRCFSYKTSCTHPEWGEPRTPHFVIKLGGPVILKGN